MLPEPAFEERVRVMCRHLDLMIEVFGEAHGCRMFRKVAPWYAKRFGPANEFNKRVVRVSSRAEFDEVLDHYRRWRAQFLDESGRVKAPVPPRAAGGVVHAGGGGGGGGADSGAEGAGGGVVKKSPKSKVQSPTRCDGATARRESEVRKRAETRKPKSEKSWVQL